jgi:hypothetical protein
MKTEVFTPKHGWSPTSLVPDEPPVLDEDDMAFEDEEEQLRGDEEARQMHPHNLEEYCEYSRGFGGHRGVHPAYIGYAVMPEDVRGVCH